MKVGEIWQLKHKYDKLKVKITKIEKGSNLERFHTKGVYNEYINYKYLRSGRETGDIKEMFLENYEKVYDEIR